MSPLRTVTYSHLGIQVTDLERSRAFYRLIGLQDFYEFEALGSHCVLFRAGLTLFEVFARKEVPSQPRPERAYRRNGVNHVAFKVRRLRKTVDRLKAAGVTFLYEYDEPMHGIRDAVCLDPDNIEIQLMEQDTLVVAWDVIRAWGRLLKWKLFGGPRPGGG